MTIKVDERPIARIRSIWGDPESFAEREIAQIADIQSLPLGTFLYAPLAHAERDRPSSTPAAIIDDIDRLFSDLCRWDKYQFSGNQDFCDGVECMKREVRERLNAIILDAVSHAE